MFKSETIETMVSQFFVLKTPTTSSLCGGNMKIQVIGFGVVGSAQAHLFHKLGHQVYAYDVQKKDHPEYVHFLSEPRSDMDLNFICTPETHVPDVVYGLLEENIQGLYVVKSTTPPGTTKNLSKKYHIHICHNPEFLREKHRFEDVENPARIIIGQCCPEHGNILIQLYKPLNKPFFITDPTTSELVKMVRNSLRATIITFWNEVHELSKKMGLNTKEVADLVDQTRTIGVWEGGNWGTRFFGKKFGGRCLPKDLNQLISAFEKEDLNPILFRAVKKFNDGLKEE